jgi:hypothetical protein
MSLSPVVCVHHMAWLVMNLSHPPDELFCIRNGSRKEDESYFMWEENDTFLPHYSSLLVSHIMYFVIYNPRNFTHHLRSPDSDSERDRVGEEGERIKMV